ncbi:MAG: membrane protein insertase YidC [Gemmatimonadetes bacterium]|nr:membrane protein insertase YidC [Gemmatimonadota bacterium]MYC73869.1 membrane protein insertase YidC [Gemmatimonadota bacterium]
MEDKRTLLAFLFIGLIFLLLPYYNEWFGLNPRPRPPSQEALPQESVPEVAPVADEQSEAERVRDPEPAEQLHSEEPLPVQSQAIERVESAENPSFTSEDRADTIVVQTPLQRFEVSTKGGTIISCKLLKYRYVDGSIIELLPPTGRGLGVHLQRANYREDISSAEFVANQSSLQVGPGEEQSLIMVAQLGGGRRLEKVLTFNGGRYGFDLQVRYEGFDDDTEAILTWENGIAFTEREPEIDLPEMRAFAYINEERVELKVDDGESDELEDKGLLKWAGIRNKYFLISYIPVDREQRSRVVLQGDHQESQLWPEYSFQLGRRLERSGSWHNIIYLGPLNYDELIGYEAELEQAIDFGWPIVSQISRFLLILFIAAHQYIPNYGWIIVLFAVVIKIIVYPLTHKTYESAAKMQELQPKITALREKYKNDNQRLSRETMKLYKEEGVNPLSGCLPLLLQMPIFIALYNLFGKTIELRQAPFVLWIQDLSLPDELLIGGFGLHVLPLLMAVSMLIQQKMTMKDPKQAVLVYMMPVVMIFIFWSMSSGLVLYWTIFNVLTIGQQLLVNHFKKKAAPSST